MSAEAPVLEPPPPPGTPARRRWMLRVLLGLALLVALAIGAVAWLVTTSGGARLVLGQVVRLAGGGIRYEGVEGSLGGPMRIALIVVDRPDMYARIEQLELDSSPFAPLRGRLLVHRLAAKSVEVRTVDTGAAAKVPVSFAPPYPLRLEQGRLGELRLGALTREAAAEKDPARKMALIDASRKSDLVVRSILVRGEGDERSWTLQEARAETPYGKGVVSGTLQTRAPFALDVKAVLEGVAGERPWRADVAAGGTLTAIDARLAGEVSGQKATGRALVEPFNPQAVRRLDLRAQDVDLAQHGVGPRTRLAIEMQLSAESRAFAGPVKVTNAEPGPWDRQMLPFASAQARIFATTERLDVLDLDVALRGGGGARGRVSLARSGVEANLVVADVDLAQLHAGLQKTRVTGRIAVQGDRAAQRFDLALKDPRFEVEGRAALANERVEVETVTVRTGAGSVVARGGMALAGNKDFRFEGNARHFDPSAFVKASKGDLNFGFVTSGALAPALAGEAKLEIAPSTLAGLPASGRIDVAGDAKRVARLDLQLRLGEGRIDAKGSFGRAGDAMDVRFDAPNLAALARPFGVQASGKLSGDAHLTGTFASPAGRVALKGSNLALPSDVYVGELVARVEAGVDPASAIDGSVQVKGVAIGAETPPTPLAQTASATLKGTRAAHRFELAATMRRDTEVRAVLAGGLDPRAKEPAWNGRVESLSMTGRGAFALASPTPLALSASRVELGEAALKGEWGEAQLAVARWTPRTLDFKGSTPGIEIQNLARSLRLGRLPRSNLVIAGNWDIRAAENFDATLEVRRVSGDLRVGEPALPLGLQDLNVKVDVARGRARGTLAVGGERVGRMTGEGSALIVRGASGWEFSPSAPLQARLVAEHTNLEALAPWLGADGKLGGRMNASIVVEGTGANPRVSGTARAEDLVLREPATGFELEKGTVALRLAGKSVVIEQLSATTPWRPSAAALARMRRVEVPAAGGAITAEGSLDLEARTGAIRAKFDKVPVTQVATRFLAMSGDVRLAAGDKELLVTGALKADAGWVGALDTPPPSVSEDVVVVRAAKPAAAAEDAPSEPIRLDVKLGLGERLYFQGRGLDTRLAGEIHLTGTPGAGLIARGLIRTVGGTYDGYGQELAIERGVLTFQGAIDNPRLNVLALRKGLPVEAGVEVLGTTSRPRVRLVSVPDVPEPEKLSWLVLGRGAADASLGDSAIMMAAARALLGGNNPGSDLTKRLGFDEIRIGRADTSVLGVLPQSTVAGRTGTASASEVVTVGRRLNRRFYLTYEQGLSDAEGALKLTWRLTRQFQLLARAGYLPGLDAVYRWTFE